MKIISHGGKDTVTGSCHELRLPDGSGILIDCGLTQGRDQSSPEIDFPVEHIKALILTHIHLDHCGRIPYLLAAGFKGPIYCSEPSAKLLPLMLEDSIKLAVTRDERRVNQILKEVEKRVIAVPYGTWMTVGSCQLADRSKILDQNAKLKTDNCKLSTDNSLQFKLQSAGHILGSAYVEIESRQMSVVSRQMEKQRIVFSGDLGAPFSPLLPAPKSPYRADVLVLESTYGDRLHAGRKERRATLRRIIERALSDRGVVLIPSFALGRTQELLYELEEIVHRNRTRFAAKNLPWEELEIIVDSPLANRFTEVFRDLKAYWDAEAKRKVTSGRHPLSFEQMTTIASHQDHLHAVQYLKKKARPCIVIASSGMCSGGRIVNYLKELLPDQRTDVLFVGYQAAGTPGQDIQRYGPRGGYVVLDGRKIDIKAGVHTISGYSAHADQQNLVNFVKRMRIQPQEIHLVHGEQAAREALSRKLEDELPGAKIII